jgi:hypothetical protein
LAELGLNEPARSNGDDLQAHLRNDGNEAVRDVSVTAAMPPPREVEAVLRRIDEVPGLDPYTWPADTKITTPAVGTCWLRRIHRGVPRPASISTERMRATRRRCRAMF